MNKNTGITILLTAAASFCLGILLAPKSGKETRKEIKDKYDQISQELENTLTEGKEKFQHKMEEFKQKIEDKKQDQEVSLFSDPARLIRETAEKYNKDLPAATENIDQKI